jgi:hypothetical protein
MDFNEKVARLIQRSTAGDGGRVTRPKRIAGVTLTVAFVCLLLWALAPRGLLFGHDAPSEWEYQPPSKQPTATHVAPAASEPSGVSLPQSGSASLPDTTAAKTPGIPATPISKRHVAIRMPLLRPAPSGATAGVPPVKRHHRHLLGLGKLWHWVRHGHRKRAPDTQ